MVHLCLGGLYSWNSQYVANLPGALFVLLCFDRSLFSSLCLLMSIVEPTEEGTTQPKRNKEATRRTTDCL